MEANQLKVRSQTNLAVARKDNEKLPLKEETDQALLREIREMEWTIRW